MTREHPRGGGCIKLIPNHDHVAHVLRVRAQLASFGLRLPDVPNATEDWRAKPTEALQ